MFTLPAHVTWKNLEDSVVLLDLNNGSYFTLNETASSIWQGLVDDRSIKEITLSMSKEYGQDEEVIRNDVDQALSYLIQEGLLIPEEAG
jgi:hypothetical protein